MLSALGTKEKTARGHKKSFGGAGNIYYLDCGDGIKHIFIDPNTKNVYIKYVHFLYIKYASIKLKKFYCLLLLKGGKSVNL